MVQTVETKHGGDLDKLVIQFGDGCMVYTRYLRSIRNLHSIMVQKTLAPRPVYTAAVDEFNAAFEDVYPLGINETLKVHILGVHVLEFFEQI